MFLNEYKYIEKEKKGLDILTGEEKISNNFEYQDLFIHNDVSTASNSHYQVFS